MSDRIWSHPAKIYESGEWPSLAKAPVLGTGDREFESPLPDNYISASAERYIPASAERQFHLRFGGVQHPRRSALATAGAFFFFR